MAWYVKSIAFYVASYGLVCEQYRILQGILWPGMSKVSHFTWHPMAWYVKSTAFYEASYGLVCQKYILLCGVLCKKYRILRGILWPGMSKVSHFTWHPMAWYV